MLVKENIKFHLMTLLKDQKFSTELSPIFNDEKEVKIILIHFQKLSPFAIQISD